MSGFLSSIWLWVFICLTLGIYSLSYRRSGLRNILLLLESLAFCGLVSPAMGVAALVSMLANHGLGLWMEEAVKRDITRGTRRNATGVWLLGTAFNLLLLLCLKYGTHFLNTSYQIWDGSPLPLLSAIGISFMALQGIGYLTDVKRGLCPASRNMAETGLLLFFFPKFTAGPLVRAGEFLPQLRKSYMLSSSEFSEALGLILGGLIKKTAADFLSFHFCDPILENPQFYTGFENILAAYGYSLRIYLDFSGYTALALGTALLFDIRLPLNFRSPYKAASLTDFWRRWHITLSGWFRDYVYIPLGGNRHGRGRMACALIATMVIAGLWHGASLCFVVWGLGHGLLLAIEKLSGWDKKVERNRFTAFIGWFLCFHIVTLGWIFFQADSLETAFLTLSRITSPTDMEDMAASLLWYWPVLTVMAVTIILTLGVKERGKRAVARIFAGLPLWVKFAITLILIILLLKLGNPVPQEFIYSRF